ncbi:tetratricopeptide repeat protein [Marinigracilibium pacificum]|uniref:Tetratricopeptide repeat protein n=1 Tax=Marinigracilibium pacificum TaxID=2729599 RepID=A0A848IZ91_9BACT|nr:tetratricopeptide repeat protein [Marinigracilibium pacificum]NMM48681.1 tetratricopeptide repeat protein [Marinigracilibium pacificum]
MRCFFIALLIITFSSTFSQEKNIGYSEKSGISGIFLSNNGTFLSLSGKSGASIITQDSSIHEIQPSVNFHLVGLTGYSINNTLTASFEPVVGESSKSPTHVAYWKEGQTSLKSKDISLEQVVKSSFGSIAMVNTSELPEVSFTFVGSSFTGVIINQDQKAVWFSSSCFDSSVLKNKGSIGQNYLFKAYQDYYYGDKKLAVTSFDKYLAIVNDDKKAFEIAIELSIQSDDKNKAKLFLNRLLDKYPDNQNALTTRALLNFELERYSDVVNDINKISSPADSLILMRARSNYNINRKADAISDFKRVINSLGTLEDHEKFSLALIELNKEGKESAAINAVSKGSDNLILITLAGKYYIDSKDYSKGIELLERTLNKGNNNETVLEYLANGAFSNSDWEKAVKYYDLLQEKKPLSAQEAFNAGQSFINLGMNSKAVAMWNKAAGAGYSNVEFFVKKAELEFESGDKVAAAADYKKAYELKANSAYAEKIATIENSLNNKSLAFQWAETAISDGSEDSQMKHIAGINAYELGNKDKAFEYLSTLKDSPLLKGKGYFYLGTLYAGREDISSALQTLDKAEKSGYTGDELYPILVKLNFQEKNYKEVIRTASKLVEIPEHKSKALVYRGLSYFETGNKQQALSDLKSVGSGVKNDKKALEVLASLMIEYKDENTENVVRSAISEGIEKPEFYMFLANVSEQNKDLKGVSVNLEKAISLGVNDEMTFIRLAETYYQLSNFSGAVKAYGQGGISSSNDKKLISHFGLSLIKINKTSEAKDQFLKAVSLSTDISEVYFELGKIHITEGENDSAIDMFNKAQNFGMNSAELNALLGKAYLQNGSFNEALTSFDKALNIDNQNIAALNGRALVNFELKKYDEALSDAYKIQESGNANSETYSIIGRVLFLKNEYQKSIEPLTKAINGGHNTGQLYGFRAIALYKNNACDEIGSDITVAENKGFTSPDLKGAKGGCLFASGEYEKALQVLLEAEKSGYTETELNKMIGSSYYHGGEFESANLYLEKALADLSNDIDVPYTLGNSYFRAKYYDKAVLAYEAAVERGSKDPLLFNNLGKARENDNKPGAALDAYDKAIELDGQYSRAFENRGVLHISMENYEDGIDDLLFAEKLNGGKLSGEYYEIIAKAYTSQERFGAAISYYEKAISNGASGAEQLTALGDLFIEIESLRDALTRFTQAINIDKDYVPAYNGRALANMYLGNNQPAVEDLNVILSNDPQNENARYNRGYLMEQLGNFEAAVSDYSKFLEIKPDDAKVVFDRANAYFSLESYSTALKDYERAIELDSENGEYYRGKGSSLYQMKDTKGACEAWTKGSGLGDRESAFYIKQYCQQ